MIDIGEVIILDKKKADALQLLGFKYVVRNIEDKEAFVFINTQELMKELNSKFEKGSFLITKYLCV